MYIGIDVGGTNLAAGLVTPEGKILARAKCPTRAEREPQAIASDMAELVLKLSKETAEEINSVGIGIPGVVDNAAGRVIRTPNMPFDDFPLSGAINERCPWQVFLGNDGNVAALGECLAGSASGASSMVMVTLGTGVGGGIVVGGRIVEGAGGAAAEIGHMNIQRGGAMCGCGRRGCWEAYASAKSLVRQTAEALRAHPDSLLSKALTGDPPHISGRTAFLAAGRGDAVAKTVVEEYLDWVAIGLQNLIFVLQPEVICIGGGVSNEGAGLIDPLRARIESMRFCQGIRQTELRLAQLGNDAGLIGAALLGK